MRKTKRIFRKILTVIIVFLFVFAASFVGFGYLVNKYTPEVDVQIGDTSNSFFEEKNANIDDRLKEIQNEDNNVKEEEIKEEETPKEEKVEEEVLIPQKEEKANKEEEESAPTTKAPIPQKSEIANLAAEKPNKITKVYAGYYDSLEEAVAAQNELDSILPDISPFIKEMNGQYIVQIGVYSNPNSADEMYKKVKELNFPVKKKSE